MLNTTSFFSSNCSLKIQDSIRTQTCKMGVHLGVCGFNPSLFHTFGKVTMILGLHFQPTPFHALVLVTSPG